MSRRAMKPSYFLAAAAVAAIAGFACGQPPEKPGAARPMVLLLDDFQIVEGEVERIGDAYRLRRGKDVYDYPAKQVLFAGESRAEVFQQMLARGVKPPAAPAAPGDVNSAALRAFPTRVQPILMNLCANCHCKPDHAGGFRLTRVADGYANAEAGHRNAKETAKFLDRNDPSASPLLAKAVTPHGGQTAPALLDRSHPAYRNLELWAHWAAGPEGSPMPPAVPAKRPAAMAPTTATATAAPTPPPVAKVDDPYDPAVFNRAMHPGK
jgi:hypothetical protein